MKFVVWFSQIGFSILVFPICSFLSGFSNLVLSTCFFQLGFSNHVFPVRNIHLLLTALVLLGTRLLCFLARRTSAVLQSLQFFLLGKTSRSSRVELSVARITAIIAAILLARNDASLVILPLFTEFAVYDLLLLLEAPPELRIASNQPILTRTGWIPQDQPQRGWTGGQGFLDLNYPLRYVLSVVKNRPDFFQVGLSIPPSPLRIFLPSATRIPGNFDSVFPVRNFQLVLYMLHCSPTTSCACATLSNHFPRVY